MVRKKRMFERERERQMEERKRENGEREKPISNEYYIMLK